MKRSQILIRSLCLLLSLSLFLTLAACGGSAPSEEAAETTESAAAPAGTAGGYGASKDAAAPETPAAPEGGDADEGAPMEYTAAEEAAGEAAADGVLPAPEVAVTGDALVLAAGEWNDNHNWPFFTNLVNSGTISFPSYGLDPRYRVKVTVTDQDGKPLAGERITLEDATGDAIDHARSGKDGAAYLFYNLGHHPEAVVQDASGEIFPLTVAQPPEDPQGEPVMVPTEEITIQAEPRAAEQTALQVMFILDTTGSMGDELAYLQKDFSAIAEEVGSEGVSWSMNFYRDHGDDYVTRCNPFTTDIKEVQKQLNAEYADGGGDFPEAVAEALNDGITENEDWREDCAKLAFLIFDAPPHQGEENIIPIQAAVETAQEAGIRLVPVVASNADRDTELFGRALAILTGGTYLFLTDDSGVGESHLEPIVGDYEVELLHDAMVRIIQDARP